MNPDAKSSRYDVLFEPVQIGPKTMRNRFYQTPHCVGAGSDRPGFQAAFRGMKAEGGWGAVSTEYCSIAPETDDIPRVSARLWDDSDIRNLAPAVERIQSHGALAGVQLWHGGPIAGRLESRDAGRAVTQVASPWSLGLSGRELDRQDIGAVIQLYVNAALRARSAGFDIVTIHMCHAASLPHHFLLPLFNTRTDEYGGSFENRARFALELVEAVRTALDGGCALAVRFSIDTLDLPYGYGDLGIRANEEGRGFLELCDHLVDLWDINASGLDWGEDAGPSRTHPENHQAQWVGDVASWTEKPVVNVGRFTNPDTMLKAITSGQCDIIGAARPSISDPFLPSKIQEGRLDEIRECIGCNVCISRWEVGGPPLVCTQNPTAAEEFRRGWHPERFAPAANADNDVLVVGAGPAGMECAMVLGKRGLRRVHLVEAGEDLGGCMRWIPHLPGLGEWARVVNYRRIQLDKLPNVQFIPKTTLGASEVLEYGAEIVIVATGSYWTADGLNGYSLRPIPGAEPGLPHVLTPEDIMLRGAPVPDGKVVVYDCDGYFVGVGMAERLAREGRDVILATPAETIASYTHFTLEASRLNRNLRELGVDIQTDRMLTEIRPDGVTLTDTWTDGEKVSLEVGATVLVTQRKSHDSLYRELKASDGLGDAGITGVFQIGDCVSPTMIADAIFSGHRLAREIDSDDPAQPLPINRERGVPAAATSGPR
jgi:dimethylamine/trimethylamine dehydrogenase